MPLSTCVAYIIPFSVMIYINEYRKSNHTTYKTHLEVSRITHSTSAFNYTLTNRIQQNYWMRKSERVKTFFSAVKTKLKFTARMNVRFVTLVIRYKSNTPKHSYRTCKISWCFWLCLILIYVHFLFISFKFSQLTNLNNG